MQEVPRRIGKRTTFDAQGARFEVRKLKRDEYSLHMDGVDRCRFGNRGEISADIEYAETFGTLPPRHKNQTA